MWRTKEAEVSLKDMTQDERLHRMRHSAAHIMAEAVLEMFPDGKFAIGPPIDNGFYYDFDLPRPLTPEDLTTIYKRMRRTIKRNLPFEHSSIDKDEARRIFVDQPYKLELIDGIEIEEISLYRHGGFRDLCEGPHVERTGQVGAFKLTSIAGAYWRGDEHKPMLQRIYGALFETEKLLEEHLERLEEAQKRETAVWEALDIMSDGHINMLGDNEGRVCDICEATSYGKPLVHEPDCPLAALDAADKRLDLAEKATMRRAKA